MELVFATNNFHKLKEIQDLISDSYSIESLQDINCQEDIPENQTTLEGNASEKSHFIANKYHVNCFADDTGLEIEALDNRPGVYSARYAGEEKDPRANMRKVIIEMEGKSNRNAQFRTVISLIINNKETFFEGLVKGTIISTPKGDQGFGYDPIFVPKGYDQTFAEMNLELKNKISHRARATKKLLDYLNELKKNV